MGTLYYALRDRCPHCGRAEKFMICKSLRMFRGYESAWDSPIDKPVMSWMDWKDVLRRDDISIMSEDDEEFDAEEFISIVEKVPENLRRRQYDAVVADEIKYGRRRFIGRDWLDSDLFSFHNEEFS